MCGGGGGVGGMVGNYCPGVGINITLIPRNLCVDPLCQTVHLLKRLDSWNTTSKAVITVYCYNYGN